MYVMLFMLFVKESRRLNEDPTIELPLIGYLCLRKELLDRVGTNVLSRWKQMYCEKLFRGTKKKLFWREIHAFSSSSYRNFWAMLIRGKFKFLFE